jgi:integrase/recombinase XerD
MDEWKTPDFLQSLKPKKTNRLSPYSETEIWDKDEFLSIIKYELYKRNKAALALMWDLNARNHEITLLRIKNIRLKEKYGEGEIPFQAKTGSGPLLLTVSFPYVRDWLNEHPFRNEPNARLICNLHTGAAIKPEALLTMMDQLKKRIIRLLETNEIADMEERNKLTLLINSKRFNPYCIRHSSICHDSDYLPEYALKKKVRWRINSKQGARYIKNRMGNEHKNKILEYNGIVSDQTLSKKPAVLSCPRCDITNIPDNKYCSKCSYPMKPSAYDEIKTKEELRITDIERKHEQDIKDLKDDITQQFSMVFEILQQHPELAYIKPAIIKKIGS